MYIQASYASGGIRGGVAGTPLVNGMTTLYSLFCFFFSPASNPFKPSQSLKRLSPGRRNLYREREPRKRFQQIGLTCRVCELDKAERDVADLSSHCQRCNRRVAPARPTRTSVCSPISILDQRSNFTPSVPSFLPF